MHEKPPLLRLRERRIIFCLVYQKYNRFFVNNANRFFCGVGVYYELRGVDSDELKGSRDTQVTT